MSNFTLQQYWCHLSCGKSIFHVWTHHIENDAHFVQECVTSRHLQVVYIYSDDQLANIMTKGSTPNASQIYRPKWPSRHGNPLWVELIRSHLKIHLSICCNLLATICVTILYMYSFQKLHEWKSMSIICSYT